MTEVNLYTNKNVRWILLSGFIFSFASSIYWFSPTWLIYGLGGTNTVLGRMLGVATISSLFIAMITSYLADKFRRDIFIKLGAVVASLGMLGLFFSNGLDQVFAFLVVTSSGSSMLYPPISSLFADSIPSKNRNRVFGTQFLLNTGAQALANLFLYFLFSDIEDSNITNLNLERIHLSLLIGAILGFTAFLISLLVRDVNAISSEDEGTVATNFVPPQENLGFFNRFKSSFTSFALPIVVLNILSAIIIGSGAGISIPYFPRFFFDIYNINLADLSLLFALITLFTAIWGKVTANLADRFGRVELIVVNQVLAVTLLYILAVYPPLILAFVTLFIRNAVMNGTGPISYAIMMEYTPRHYRSQISAVNQVSWSLFFGGGQIIGGILVDGIGFWFPFIITATLYLIATVLIYRIKHYERSIEVSNQENTSSY